MNVEEIYEIYHLPIIEKEGITEIEYNHRCKYLKLYIKLIEKCKSMTDIPGYKEEHHILPHTMNGSDDKENLVYMPIRYHIMAHIVIVEAYPSHRGLRYALLMITSDGDKNNQVYRQEGLKTLSTRLLTTVRENSVLKLKELGRTEEHRRKLSEANKGKHLSEEHRRKISEGGKGLKRSEETRRKISEAQQRYNPRKGRKLSEETKKKMSEAHKGKPNGMKGKKLPEETKKKISKSLKDKHMTYVFSEEHRKNLSNSLKGRKSSGKFKSDTSVKIVGPDSKIYNSMKEASIVAGVTVNTLSKWVRGLTMDNHGWSLLNKEEYFKNLSNKKIINSRKVINNNTGVIYNSINEASEKTGFKARAIKDWVTGKSKYNYGWSFYEEDQN